MDLWVRSTNKQTLTHVTTLQIKPNTSDGQCDIVSDGTTVLGTYASNTVAQQIIQNVKDNLSNANNHGTTVIVMDLPAKPLTANSY